MVLFIQWLQIYLYKRFEALIFQFFWPFIVCKNHQNLLKQSYYSVNWLWRCHQFEFGSCFPPTFLQITLGSKHFWSHIWIFLTFQFTRFSQDSFFEYFSGLWGNLYLKLNALTYPTYLQLPLRQWGAGNFYLLVLSKAKR